MIVTCKPVDMMSNTQYLIGELAEKAGVSVRTIRYYISEGLLPPPQTRGRYSVYDEDYLHRIRLIKRLRDAFLPIKEIRHMLETRTEEELEKFLNHYASQRGPGSDALAYISEVVEGQPATPAVELPRFTHRTSAPQPAPDGALWQRFELAEGVELHVSAEALARFGRTVQRLIHEGRERLRREPPDGPAKNR